jgi:NitT/TauT family transport system permease protein
MRRTLRFSIFIVAVVAVWNALSASHIWPNYMFPSPKMTALALQQGFADHTFTVAIVASLRRVIVGFVISAAGGIALGALIGASSWLEDTLGTVVSGLQSLPSICWAPVAILWFGLTESAILFVTVVGSLFAVTINLVTGIRSVPRIYIVAGQNLGARGASMFLYILLPASLPHILSGLRQGWALSWRSLISGEMIFLSLGLGQLLMMGRDLNDLSQVFAVMLLITTIGYAVERFAFAPMEVRLRRRWGLQ